MAPSYNASLNSFDKRSSGNFSFEQQNK
uniref:Uncharacterized protein n=1 Tax=Rhizophora mucronata TaxID=61149 RepID=A0A2P2PJG9_RHIMU